MKKFIESYNISDYEVLSDTGFVDVVASHKTIKYEKWIIRTNNLELNGADNHIIFDEEMNEVFVKDLFLKDLIQTKNGLEQIIYIENTHELENMYDLELSMNSNHRYFTNDILSHNTMTLSSLTAGFIKNGYDCLYLTLEMSREDISKLIDANYTDIKINEIAEQSKDSYKRKILELKNQNVGRLFVEEFPTGNAGCNNFRALLDDLKYKKNFVPQIIIIDYINLMRCDRYNEGNSYTLVKGISEEVRGLAVEGQYCIVSATQTNRSGAKSSDVDMTDTAESYGLPQTVDLLVALMTNDTLKEENILIMKALKNRLYGVTGFKFPVKTMFEYARLLDCDKDHDIVLNNNEKMKSMMDKSDMRAKLKKLKVNTSNKSDDDVFE